MPDKRLMPPPATDPRSRPTGRGSPTDREQSGEYLADGTLIRYDRRQGSEPALVFIPGWCCSRHDWDAIANALPDRASVSVSLPGQGESPSGGRIRSVGDLGAGVAELVDHLGHSDIVPIGHSMGGAVAIEAALVLRERARRVICLDSLTYDSWYRRRDEAFVRRTLQAYAADFPTTIRTLVEHLFVDRTRPALIDAVATAMSSAPVTDALTALRALLEWDRDRALAESTATIDVVAARAFLDPEIAKRLARTIRVMPVDFGGHFFLREEPDQTAALIAELLDGSTALR